MRACFGWCCAALVALVALAACSSFESAPPSVSADAGPTPVNDGGAAVDVDSAAPSDDAGADAGPSVVYTWDFERIGGWSHTRANLALINGRTAMGLSVCGTGGGMDAGVFSADAVKTIGPLGAGRYRVHVWARHENGNGLPTLGVKLVTGVYANVSAPVPMLDAASGTTAMTGAWQEIVAEVSLSDGEAYPTIFVTALPGDGTATGCFWVDDLTIERL